MRFQNKQVIQTLDKYIQAYKFHFLYLLYLTILGAPSQHESWDILQITVVKSFI